jgi:hypothetical protein
MRQPEVLPDFTRYLCKDALRGARIGVLRQGLTRVNGSYGWGPLELDNEVVIAYDAATRAMRELGAEGSPCILRAL